MRNTIVLLKTVPLLVIFSIRCGKKCPSEIASIIYVLQGVICDNGSELVANAEVPFIDETNSQQSFTGNTTRLGEYAIQISAPGLYTLRVENNNFEPCEQQNPEISDIMGMDN